MSKGKEVSTELAEIASALKREGLRCNCDLDNWEPEMSTGHSLVCRIHKQCMAVKFSDAEMPVRQQGTTL